MTSKDALPKKTRKKRAVKIKENDLTRNKEFCDVLDKMIKTAPISDVELAEWVKKNKKS